MKLKNKVALVTGSGQGIGQETAIALAEEGCKVVVSDVTDKVYDVAKKIAVLDSDALALKADVSNSKDVQNLVEKTIAKFGKIDILVNNAGIFKSSSVIEMKEEDWDKILDVNLKGVYLCSKAVLPKMIDQSYGKIINLSSASGAIIGGPNNAHYSASKAGVAGFTKALAMEVASYGINVNAIAPGTAETELHEKGLKELGVAKEQVIEVIPLRRIAQPRDIANLIVFLASDKSNYITGQIIPIDGGLTVQ